MTNNNNNDRLTRSIDYYYRTIVGLPAGLSIVGTIIHGPRVSDLKTTRGISRHPSLGKDTSGRAGVVVAAINIRRTLVNFSGGRTCETACRPDETRGLRRYRNAVRCGIPLRAFRYQPVITGVVAATRNGTVGRGGVRTPWNGVGPQARINGRVSSVSFGRPFQLNRFDNITSVVSSIVGSFSTISANDVQYTYVAFVYCLNTFFWSVYANPIAIQSNYCINRVVDHQRRILLFLSIRVIIY